MEFADFEIRRADPADADAMASAHRDSIRSIGAAYYQPPVVEDWGADLTGELYRSAMETGEVFFIATGRIDEEAVVLGFASDYPRRGSTHGTSVYVRGIAARRGIGSALLRAAEEHAVRHGADSIEIEASMAGVEFYRAHGYVEVGRGETHLRSGRPIACVFMKKPLLR